MRPLFLLALIGCDYDPQQSPNHGPPANVIAGAVVANGVTTPSTAVIFVTNADNPMPPNGTGSPSTFSTVPANQFTGEGTEVQSADYSVSSVPDGTYLITGFMDNDNDFHPRISALAGATCGDIVGAHLVDLFSTELASVSVEGGELYDDITLALGRSLPVERPAHSPIVYDLGTETWVPGNPIVSVGRAATGHLEIYTLRSTAVHAAFQAEPGFDPVTYDLEGPYVVQQPGKRWDPFLGTPTCETAFYGWVKDNDQDGQPDPHPDFPPALGLLDIWPRVGITWLGKPIDSNNDGYSDGFKNDLEPGEKWAGLGVVSPALVAFGELPVGIPFLADELDFLFLPAAQHSYRSSEADCPGAWSAGTCSEVVQDPTQIPRGAWAITVISETGQTWTVPNELVQASVTGTGFNPLSQFTWLNVRD